MMRRGLPRRRGPRLVVVGAVIAVLAVTVVPAGAATAATGTHLLSVPAAIARVDQIPCAEAKAPTSGVSVPVAVVRRGLARVVLIGVCIDGAGPFPFALDTGSSLSLIGPALSTHLHLPATGAPLFLGVLGCNPTPHKRVQLHSWSAGGFVLTPQTLAAGRLGSPGQGLHFYGLLGSDVLARFGAIHINYANQTLSVASSEGPPFTGGAPPPGSSAVSAFDAAVHPRVDVAALVFSEQGRVVAIVNVLVRGRQTPFIVDTGAAYVAANSSLASQAGLRVVRTEELSDVNCHAHIPIYRGGGWRLGRFVLPEEQILGATVGSEPLGLLGSPVLSRYGAFVLDYRSGRLLLGPS
ncbi:MAG: hypothetical protein JWM85_2324 [Acidimicrobiaceae bacterium]|nr:hypothetical protein [Acidimicrobiaceae bacterium]